MEILHIESVALAMLFHMREYLNLYSLVTRRENFYFNRSKTIVQITDKTHYWICPFLSNHLALSTPLLGIPVLNTNSWTTLGSDISFQQDHTHSQQREVAIPEAQKKYATC